MDRGHVSSDWRVIESWRNQIVENAAYRRESIKYLQKILSYNESYES